MVQLNFTGDVTTTATNIIKTLSDNRYIYNSTGSTSPATPASSCGKSVSLRGILVDTPGDASTTGPTGGLYDPTSVPINTNVLLPSLISGGTCAFPGNASKVRNDIAYLPSTDEFFDSFVGFRTVPLTGTNPDYYPSGNPYSGTGKVRTDTPVSILHAAENAADSQAQTIRNDTTYQPIIYTIGLGGTSFQPIDD